MSIPKPSQDQVGLQVHVDDYQKAFTRSYSDDMVTSLAGDLMRDNHIFWQKVLANEDCRPASVYVIWNEGAI